MRVPSRAAWKVIRKSKSGLKNVAGSEHGTLPEHATPALRGLRSPDASDIETFVDPKTGKKKTRFKAKKAPEVGPNTSASLEAARTFFFFGHTLGSSPRARRRLVRCKKFESTFG